MYSLNDLFFVVALLGMLMNFSVCSYAGSPYSLSYLNNKTIKLDLIEKRCVYSLNRCIIRNEKWALRILKNKLFREWSSEEDVFGRSSMRAQGDIYIIGQSLDIARNKEYSNYNSNFLTFMRIRGNQCLKLIQSAYYTDNSIILSLSEEWIRVDGWAMADHPPSRHTSRNERFRISFEDGRCKFENLEWVGSSTWLERNSFLSQEVHENVTTEVTQSSCTISP